jgi:hypothetical protein
VSGCRKGERVSANGPSVEPHEDSPLMPAIVFADLLFTVLVKAPDVDKTGIQGKHNIFQPEMKPPDRSQ